MNDIVLESKKRKIENSHMKILNENSWIFQTADINTLKSYVVKLKSEGRTDNYIISILNTLKKYSHIYKTANIHPKNLGLKTKRYLVTGQIKPEHVIGIGKVIEYASKYISALSQFRKTSQKDVVVAILLSTTTSVKGSLIHMLTKRHLISLAEIGYATITLPNNENVTITPVTDLYTIYFYDKYKVMLDDLDDNQVIVTTVLDIINKSIRELYVQLSQTNGLKSMGLQIFQRLNDTTKKKWLDSAHNRNNDI